MWVTFWEGLEGLCWLSRCLLIVGSRVQFWGSTVIVSSSDKITIPTKFPVVKTWKLFWIAASLPNTVHSINLIYIIWTKSGYKCFYGFIINCSWFRWRFILWMKNDVCISRRNWLNTSSLSCVTPPLFPVSHWCLFPPPFTLCIHFNPSLDVCTRKDFLKTKEAITQGPLGL